jgi:hypothetical protein
VVRIAAASRPSGRSVGTISITTVIKILIDSSEIDNNIFNYSVKTKTAKRRFLDFQGFLAEFEARASIVTKV